MRPIFYLICLCSVNTFSIGQTLHDYLIPPPQQVKTAEQDGLQIENYQNALSIIKGIKSYSTPTCFKKVKLKEPKKRVIDLEISIGDKTLKDQGYAFTLEKNKISINAKNEQALHYAIITIEQVLEYAINEQQQLPIIEIIDWPNFERRGYMLDISRDKVPSMTTLYSIIDKLDQWKINEFQLYTEHTFAFKNHETVWKDASPMTAEQIEELDQYCQDRFIDLVPNQNSFGHMENWLKHDKYLELAECPEDCDTKWGKRKRHSLDPTNPKSLALMEELYAELAPLFSSEYFNIGGDETIELCNGKSKEVCNRIGPGRVYLDYLTQLNLEINQLGKKTQFWGDIILHHPELIKDIPKNMTALVWGYEADYPFDTTLPHFERAGLDFYVCPGTSTWRSIIGRNYNAFKNLENAAINGQQYKAKGYLNTTWGDYGHWQPLSTTYPTMLVGASYAWNYQECSLGSLEHQLSHYVFKDKSGITSKAVLQLGDAYLAAKIPPGNANAFHQLLRRYMWTMKGNKQTKELTIQNLIAAEKEIDDALKVLASAKPSCDEADILLIELNHAARLAKHGIHLGIARLKAPGFHTKNIDNQTKKELAKELSQLIDEFEEIWLLRNRKGGLSDSSEKLIGLLDSYSTNK